MVSSTDIIVIGAGGCGLMASLVAAKNGASVLLLEKTDAPGGGSALSAKGIRAAGTRFQRAAGVEDGPERYAQDILNRNNNESDVALTDRLAQTSWRIVDLLADVVGIEFNLGEFVFGHSTRRGHSWKADKTITDFLFEAVLREHKVQVRFSTPVLSLQQESKGSVTGVVTDEGGLPATKVILASGGFGASQELLAEHITRAVGIPFPGHHGSTGDGIKMGMAAGAAVENMGSFQPYPGYIGPEKRAVSPEVATSGGIMVNARGERFVDETRYPGGVGKEMLDMPDKHVWLIFDQRIYQLHAKMLEDFLATEDLVQAQTPGELASKLGADAAGLERTVRECNSMANNGKDDFGRRLTATFERPFYGIKVTVALYHTQGGLKVNTDGQVLRPNGSVIPNLYAGGGAATGVSGTGVEGYLPGNGLLSSLGLGMLAAEHAVASLKVDVRSS